MAKAGRKSNTLVASDWERSRARWLSGGHWIDPAPAGLRPDASPANALVGNTSSKTWVPKELRRLKAADQIPKSAIKADLARLLECQMAEAAKRDPSIRPIKWRSILLLRN
jgi:hypothetical protein